MERLSSMRFSPSTRAIVERGEVVVDERAGPDVDVLAVVDVERGRGFFLGSSHATPASRKMRAP